MTTKLMAKRPFLLYVLIILFLLAGAVSLAGTFGIFQAWNWWLYFTSLTSIISQVFLGVLITLAWVSTAVILWLRLPWAILYGGLVTMLISIWSWIERLVLAKNPLPFNRHILSLAITCIFLLFVFSSLYLVAPSMKLQQPSQKEGGSTSIQPTGEKNDQSTARN